MLLQEGYYFQVAVKLLQAQCRVMHVSSRQCIAMTLDERALRASIG